MSNNLVQEQELLEWTGYDRPADLRRFLDINRIPYRHGKARKIVTTQKAIDEALANSAKYSGELDFAD